MTLIPDSTLRTSMPCGYSLLCDEPLARIVAKPQTTAPSNLVLIKSALHSLTGVGNKGTYDIENIER